MNSKCVIRSAIIVSLNRADLKIASINFELIFLKLYFYYILCDKSY